MSSSLAYLRGEKVIELERNRRGGDHIICKTHQANQSVKELRKWWKNEIEKVRQTQ